MIEREQRFFYELLSHSLTYFKGYLDKNHIDFCTDVGEIINDKEDVINDCLKELKIILKKDKD